MDAGPKVRTGWRLRPAGEADRPVLERFMAALQDFERAMDDNRVPGAEMAASHVAWLLGWAAQHPGGGCLLAEDDEGPCGFVLWGVDTDGGTYVPQATRTYGVVSDLWVEPRARGTGVAAALVGAAEAHLAAAGLARAEISALAGNARAIALYRRLGFRPASVTLAKPLG